MRFSGYHGPIQTIMVVDDDPAQRELIRDFLSPLGFKVLAAASGRSCLAMVQDEHPDAFPDAGTSIRPGGVARNLALDQQPEKNGYAAT